MNWTYAGIMLAAWATGFGLLLLTRQPLGVDRRGLAAIALGAFCGGMIGAKLPFVLADWPGFLSGAAWFNDGKTIVSGLLGGYFGAMATEWALGIQGLACDLLAAPLAAAIGVGRLACFHAGCCYGVPTSLPWGVNFGDGCPRHPTQLYESAFHLLAAVVLFQFQRRQMFRGQLIRVYFVAYFVFRFVTEFIRPEPRIYFGLTGYQMGTLLLAPFFALWCCPGARPQWFRTAATARTDVSRQHAGRSSAEADPHALPGMPEAGGGGDFRARRQGLPAASVPRARHDRRPGLFRSAALLPPRRSAASSTRVNPVAGRTQAYLDRTERSQSPPSLSRRTYVTAIPRRTIIPASDWWKSPTRATCTARSAMRAAPPASIATWPQSWPTWRLSLPRGAAGRAATQRRRTAPAPRNCWKSSTTAGSCRSNTS